MNSITPKYILTPLGYFTPAEMKEASDYGFYFDQRTRGQSAEAMLLYFPHLAKYEERYAAEKASA